MPPEDLRAEKTRSKPGDRFENRFCLKELCSLSVSQAFRPSCAVCARQAG
jgi:hypothetical protein